MSDKRLFLIRHGETAWNITGRLNSTTDVNLSERGQKDLLALRQTFSFDKVERIISSPLKRAVETAQILSIDQKIEVDKRLVEVDFGPFEGKTPQECAEGPLAEAFTLWRKEDEPVIPEGAEDFHNAARRAQNFVEDIQQFEGTTLIVSHGVFLRVLLCSCVLGMNPAWYRRLRLDNGKLTVVSWEGKLVRLTKLNASSV